MSSRFAIALLCVSTLLTAAPPQKSPPESSYLGVWVMKLGQRNFMILTLQNNSGKISGALSRPDHFETSDGFSFSQITRTVLSEPVIEAALNGGSLHLAVANLKDKEKDEFDMTLTGNDRASIKPDGVPIDAWPFERVHAAGLPKVAVDWNQASSYTVEQESKVSKAQMRQIFEEDQKPREDVAQLTPQQLLLLQRQDAERRQQTRALFESGQLHTAEDFSEAAFIFQHGNTSDDYLLAHTLALIAVAKGDPGALWISTATLDRYLQSIGKPQIYGTQFTTKAGGTTQDPYNSNLISDALRRQLGVPSLATQKEQLKYWSEQFKAASGKSK